VDHPRHARVARRVEEGRADRDGALVAPVPVREADPPRVVEDLHARERAAQRGRVVEGERSDLDSPVERIAPARVAGEVPDRVAAREEEAGDGLPAVAERAGDGMDGTGHEVPSGEGDRPPPADATTFRNYRNKSERQPPGRPPRYVARAASSSAPSRGP
jgi:hypothetical protein